MVYSIFPALRADIGFTDAQIPWIGSLFSWIYTIAMPIAGRFADMYRRDRLIVLSLVLWSAATLGCAISQSVMMFLFFRAVLGITESLYYPAAVGALGTLYAPAARSRALAIHQSAQFAGLIAGGWYGGWMADEFSWRLGFAVMAVAGILYSFVLVKRLPAVSPARNLSSAAEPRRIRSLLTSRCYLAICTAFFFFCAMLWVFYAWYPSFLQERYHLSMAQSGFAATLFPQISCAAGVVLGGTLADRLYRRVAAVRFYVGAGGLLLAAPFGYLTFAAGSLELAKLYSAAFGLFAGFLIANVFAAALDVTPPGNYSLAAGILNSVGGVSASIVIWVAGAVRGTLGFDGLLLWVGAACCASAAALVITARFRFTDERQRILP